MHDLGEDHVDLVDYLGPRPEVFDQFEHSARALDDRLGFLVGLYVGAAEPVDGLLGVAHEEELAGLKFDIGPEGGASVLYLAEEERDLALQGVGVLKLV